MSVITRDFRKTGQSCCALRTKDFEGLTLVLEANGWLRNCGACHPACQLRAGLRGGAWRGCFVQSLGGLVLRRGRLIAVFCKNRRRAWRGGIFFARPSTREIRGRRSHQINNPARNCNLSGGFFRSRKPRNSPLNSPSISN